MLFECHRQALRQEATAGSLFQCLTILLLKCFSSCLAGTSLMQLEPVPYILSLDTREKQGASLSPLLLRKLQRAMRPCLRLFFPELTKPIVLSCSSWDVPSDLWTFLHPPLDALNYLHLCLKHGARNCAQYSKGAMQTLNTLGESPLLTVLQLMHPRVQPTLLAASAVFHSSHFRWYVYNFFCSLIFCI